jgi:hypothetical protein
MPDWGIGEWLTVILVVISLGYIVYRKVQDWRDRR